jgi:hypothetical protein
MSGESRATAPTRRPSVGSNRQQTQAKSARERTLRERRARKFEKRRLAAAERKERASTAMQTPPEPVDPS